MKQNYSKLKQNKPISKVGMVGEGANMEVVAKQAGLVDVPIQKSAYSGGFKVPPVLKTAEPNSVVRSIVKPDKDDIYRELGVSVEPDSVKMNGYMPQNKSQLQDKLVENIDAKIERIRLERAKLFDSGLKNLNMEQSRSPEKYNETSNLMKIYDGPGRSQIALQQPSSIQAMTLDNVETQLEAHRMYLKPLEERYFQKKGKSPPRSVFNVEEQVQEEKKKLIYIINKPPKADLPSKVTEQQLDRLFEEKRKADPKLAEYQAMFRQYEVQKTTQKLVNKSVRETLFKADWDKYKQEVGKQKSRSKPKQGSLSKASESIVKFEPKKESKQKITDNLNIEKQDRLHELEEKYSLEKIVLTKNDKYITQFIFKQIDPDKNGFISKLELFDYVMSQPIIVKDFGIDEKWFYSDLDTFPVRRKGILSLEECLQFLSVQRQLKHPQIQLVDPNKDSLVYESEKGSLKLNKRDIQILEEVFKGLDPYDDKIVKRQELIDSLYMDPQVAEMLDRPAVYISVVDKSVTVRQILQLMISDFRNQKNPKAKKSKQYITLSQFVDYFNRWDSINLSNIANSNPIKSQTNEPSIFDIQPEYLQLLQDIFNSVARVYQDYICVIDFLEACRKDPQIQAISDELCRINSVQTGLGLENIGLTLKRMMNQTDEYGCWNEIKLFFSRRGRPLDWDINQLNLKKSVREAKKNQIESQLAKTEARLTKKFQTQKSFGLNVSKESFKPPGRFTVPDPFNITDMKAANKIQITEEGKKDFEILKEGIKALPLNKQILQPKFDKLQKERQSRSSQIRQQSKKRTAEIEKPFSFYEKEIIEKTLREAALRQQRMKPAILESEEISNAGQIDKDNLKKTYQEIIDEQAKQRGDPKKTTQFKVSDNLYPKNPAELKKQKNKKVQEKILKLDQIEKRKTQQLDQIKKAKVQQNRKKQEVLKRIKKIQQQQEKQKDEIIKKAGDATFKPKINEYTPNPNAADQKASRLKKKEEKIKKFMQEQERKRQKRLAYQQKQEEKLNLEDFNEDQIIDKLSDIEFEDLLDEEGVRKQYLKLKDFQTIPFANKRKVSKDRRNALMARQRIQMEKQDKRRRQQLKDQAAKRNKQRNASVEKKATGQLERTKDKKIDPKDNKFDGTFAFHKSKALRRYRDIMEGKTPLSEYDRMSHQQQSVKALSVKDYDEEAKHIDNALQQADASQENESIKEQ